MRYFKTILILAIPLILVIVYAVLPYSASIDCMNFSLQKIGISKVPFLSNISAQFDKKTEIIDSTAIVEDTLLIDNVAVLDTTSQKILFFGDSMLEGLGPRMCDYAMENGHELYTVCWYSSSTEVWAKSDTLKYFLNKVNPDYIMICIGSNEQFTKDIDSRRQYVRSIRQQIGKIPTVWICPPEWKKDRAFNIMLQEELDSKEFFDSRLLTYERKSDHAHPTTKSAANWMDSIAVWMQSNTVSHPIIMAPPSTKQKRHWNAVYLAPPK